MPSINPTGYDAYKIVRRDEAGKYHTLFRTSSPFDLTYEPQVITTPRIESVPTVWMFVFQTYQQALDFFQEQHLSESVCQIWRVCVFEEELPSPKRVLAPGERYSGILYWNHWWNDDELNWLEEQGITLIEPPSGTRVCSQLQMMERVQGDIL